MKRRIILMRHADAELRKHHQNDFERTISHKGLAELKSLQSSFYKYLNGIDYVFCSTAIRTRQTLEQIEGLLPFNLPIDFDDNLYHASKDTLWQTINSVGEKQRDILIIGHNPGLSHFAEEIDANCIDIFSTSTMLIATTNEPYSSTKPYSLTIEEIVRPTHLLHC